ncbi:MAG: hypothetical protein WC263_03690 [Candidatus Micrarchaeia archaeon]|jgi:hypothetical protein
MPNLRNHAAKAMSPKNKMTDEEIQRKFFSPSQEKARLLQAITAVLQTKSNASLAGLLASLEGTPDHALKYPQIKRAQRKFSEFLQRPEAQN